MCGIVFLEGINASNRLPICLKKIKHRGPDDTHKWESGATVLGFTRLAINGVGDIGKQPQLYSDWVGAINGEIYNYRNLIIEHQLTDILHNDTSVVLPLLSTLGNSLIKVLDGFYAAVFYNCKTKELILLRDSIGKKPLFFGCSDGEFFVVSELKAIDTIDWFEEVPKGLTRVDVANKKIIEVINHQSKTAEINLNHGLHEAVKKRLPVATQPVGLFLSGGLDSSIIAAIASKLRPDITCFALGGADCTDLPMVTKVTNFLGLKDVRTIPIPSFEELEKYISEIVYVTESFNPSVVSNGLATYLLAQSAKSAGIKVVLTGEGADELFGGYFNYLDSQELKVRRKQLITDMHFTELRRLDLCTMAHGVEARCPFLDRAVIGLSEHLEFNDIYTKNMNKVILRESFRSYLPQDVIERPKTSFDVGSGIREIVVKYLRRNGKSEREELLNIWLKHFNRNSTDKYFHSYPAFDDAIERRGHRHR